VGRSPVIQRRSRLGRNEWHDRPSESCRHRRGVSIFVEELKQAREGVVPAGEVEYEDPEEELDF